MGLFITLPLRFTGVIGGGIAAGVGHIGRGVGVKTCAIGADEAAAAARRVSKGLVEVASDAQPEATAEIRKRLNVH